jgi:hypothetical protein
MEPLPTAASSVVHQWQIPDAEPFKIQHYANAQPWQLTCRNCTQQKPEQMERCYQCSSPWQKHQLELTQTLFKNTAIGVNAQLNNSRTSASEQMQMLFENMEAYKKARNNEQRY